MAANSDLRRLFDYTKWANHRVLDACATLTLDEFKRDIGSSHGGVRGTLTHMLWAEVLWLERFKGVATTRAMDESEYPDLGSMRERWSAAEAHRDSWLDNLPGPAAESVIHYQNLKGEPFQAPLWQLVHHVANHGSYHRGQVVTFLRQLGKPGVATDMVMWERSLLPATGA